MIEALLLDDAPGPAPLALALQLGWATLPAPLRLIRDLTAARVRETPHALALVPVAEYALLQEDYTILPALAAGGQHSAAAMIRADRRLDDVDRPLLDLGGVTRTTECLIRATLSKFYGIAPGTWLRDGDTLPPPAPPPPDDGDTAAATTAEQVTIEIREGGEALHLLDEPGNATVTDLGRAWFILTGLPYASHLLVAPRIVVADAPDEVRAFCAALTAARDAAHERRRELRRDLSRQYGVSRELLNDFYNDQYGTLTGDAEKAVLALFARGAWGMNLPTVTQLDVTRFDEAPPA